LILGPRSALTVAREADGWCASTIRDPRILRWPPGLRFPDPHGRRLILSVPPQPRRTLAAAVDRV